MTTIRPVVDNPAIVRSDSDTERFKQYESIDCSLAWVRFVVI